MVRPIEIADTLSKTELVAKMKEKLKASPDLEQREAAESLKEKTSADAARTKETERGDLLIISNDQRKEGEKRKLKNKQDEPEETPDEETDEEQPEHLDLKA